MDPTTKKTTMIKIVAITHSRKKFYNGRDIHWYEFQFDDGQQIKVDGFQVGNRSRFLRVPETKYYEYGGTHEQALRDLTSARFIDIVEGVEI